MHVTSVNVGGPRPVAWRGRTVQTAIFKEPVAGRVRIAGVNVDGDQQADRRVHGGPAKAVYAYPREHYAFWREQLGLAELAPGAFGENLTTDGLLESDAGIGDRWRVGTAELVVTQPRTPCFKLGIRFGRADMVQRFHRSGRSGIYFAIARAGDVGAGDPIELLARGASGLTVADVVGLYAAEAPDPALLARAADDPGLADGWRGHFRKLLDASHPAP